MGILIRIAPAERYGWPLTEFSIYPLSEDITQPILLYLYSKITMTFLLK